VWLPVVVEVGGGANRSGTSSAEVAKELIESCDVGHEGESDADPWLGGATAKLSGL
jgi:hypothetical protein